jgi:hypothetical protein
MDLPKSLHASAAALSHDAKLRQIAQKLRAVVPVLNRLTHVFRSVLIEIVEIAETSGQRIMRISAGFTGLLRGESWCFGRHQVLSGKMPSERFSQPQFSNHVKILPD